METAPVTVKAVQALYMRHTIIPSELCHLWVVQRWPRVQPRFQVSRARPRSQRIESMRLARREVRGGRWLVKWSMVVRKRERMERRETVRSCEWWC